MQTLPLSNRPMAGIAALLGLVFVLVLGLSRPAAAAPLEIGITDIAGYPGQRLYLPVWVSTDVDSLGGFQIWYTLDRPNMMGFNADETIDSTFICVDPPGCTVIDTTMDTTSTVPSITEGTLVENWNLLSVSNSGFNTVFQVTGLADLLELSTVIPPFVQQEKLIMVAVDIECHPDPFGGGEAIVQPNLVTSNFSDPRGSTITSFSMGAGTITVLEPVMCDLDYSGSPDAVDLNAYISCLFFTGCPVCESVIIDFNCDGSPDASDLNIMIDYLFFGAPEPSCP